MTEDFDALSKELTQVLAKNRAAAAEIELVLISEAAAFVSTTWGELAKRSVVNHPDRAARWPDDVRRLKVALADLQRDAATIVTVALEPALWARMSDSALMISVGADPKWDAHRRRSAHAS